MTSYALTKLKPPRLKRLFDRRESLVANLRSEYFRTRRLMKN